MKDAIKMKEQLEIAQRALSQLSRTASVFGKEPNCTHPSTTMFSRSGSMQLLALSMNHDWA